MGFFSKYFGKTKLTENSKDFILKFLSGGNRDISIKDSYAGNIDVYSVIRKIVSAYTAVPTVVERKVGDEWEEVTGTPLNELIANPNRVKGYTWETFDEKRLIYLLATGNIFTVSNSGLSGGQIKSLDVLPTDLVDVYSNGDYLMPSYSYMFSLGAYNKKFAQEEVQHIRFFNPYITCIEDSYKGLSPIHVAAKAVSTSNQRWEADEHLLKNKGKSGILTNRSEYPLNLQESEQKNDAFKEQIGGAHNFGGIHLTNANLDFIKLEMSSSDLQILEKGVEYLRALCNVYGVPSELFNDPANKVHNTRKEAEKSLYTNAVIPIAKKLEAADTEFIAKSFDKNLRIRKDFSEVEALQSDKKLEAEKDMIRVNGISSILAMPISEEGKKELLRSEYEITDKILNSLFNDNNEINRPII